MESVCIFGELGAAKTTGSAAWILLKYLELGMGGTQSAASSPATGELIEAYAGITGRAESLVVVSPKNAWRCNLIRYALMRPGIVGSRVETIVSLLMTIVEAAERSDQGGGQQDKFWQRSLRQILRNGIEVCIAARGEVTMKTLHEVITSAPRRSHAEVHDKGMAGGFSLLPAYRGSGNAREIRARAKATSSWRRVISCGSFPTCRTIRAAPSSPLTASWRTCCLTWAYGRFVRR